MPSPIEKQALQCPLPLKQAHAPFQMQLQHLQYGQIVNRMSLYLLPLTSGAVPVSSAPSSRRPRKSAKWQSSAPGASASKTAASSAATPLVASAPGLARCCLADDSGSIVADVPQAMMDQLQPKMNHSALRVLVDAVAEMHEGRIILKVSSMVAEPKVTDSTKSGVSIPSRPSVVSPLLNRLSGVRHGAGVWLFRVVAGELFVLLHPVTPLEDADLEPPHALLRDDLRPAGVDVADPALRYALASVREGTRVTEDEYILLHSVVSAPFLHQMADRAPEEEKKNKRKRPTAMKETPQRVLTRMFSGVVTRSGALAGDNIEELAYDRDHWHAVSRAMIMLAPEWAESLTQVTTGLSAMAEYWAECGGIGDDDTTDEEESITAPLFDENDRLLVDQSNKSATKTTATTTVVDSQPAELVARHIAEGITPASPRPLRRFVRELQLALNLAAEKFQALRKENEKRAAEEEAENGEEDEEEDEENEEGETEEATESETAAAVTDEVETASEKASSKRRGGAATSATQFVGAPTSTKASPPPMTPARLAEVTAQVRSLKSAIGRKDRKPIPVAVLTGFLGAGKTTLLNHLLSSAHGRRIGVIVNDFSHVNVDASLLAANQSEHLVELSNGCICCTLRADLFTSVAELAASGKVDYIAIESTGIGEPAPIVATFGFELEDGSAITTFGLKSLSEIVTLDCVTTVVDSQAIYQRLQKVNAKATTATADADSTRVTRSGRRASSGSALQPVNAAETLSRIQAGEKESKSLLTLLTEQLEFCNVLVLNKSDLLSREQLDTVAEFVKLINVNADIIEATHGKVDVAQIIGSNKFVDQHSLESPLLAFAAAEWHAELTASRAGKPVSESAEYGITSFVYNRRVGFDGARFEAFLRGFESDSHAALAGLMRVKGVFWIGDNDTAVGLWQATTPGTKCNISHVGGWLLDLCAWDCVTSGKELLGLSSRWHATVADRYTQLVFIGVGIDQAAITAALDACVMTREELQEVLDDEEDEDENEEEESTDDAKPDQTEAPPLKLLKPIIDFDPNPDAPPTCALRA